MDIKLTDEDRKLGKEIMAGRNLEKRKFYGDTSFFDASRGSKKCDYLAALGEIAVAKCLDLPLSEVKIIPPFGKDSGYDLTWHGFKIEVKYTFYENGHLFHRPDRPLIADILILVTGTEWEMRIAGYIFKKDFESHAVTKDFGYSEKPVLAVSQKRLCDIKKLISQSTL